MGIELIEKNTQEIVTADELERLTQKKDARAYIGFAPTGRLHIGYFIPAVKVRDFVKSGFKVTFLIADIHAHLDDLKTPWKLLDARSEYYTKAFKAMLKAIGTDISRIKFVRGSHFQYKKSYIEDLYRLMAITTLKRARRAAAEIVRFGKEPKVGGFVYPLMQALDVAALKADVAFGGIDQRGPYMLARELLPELGYSKPVCVFTPLLPSLGGKEKMSASVPHSNIDILDGPREIKNKIAKAFCPPEVEGNGIIAFFKHVIFRLKAEITVPREKKHGGPVKYSSYEELEKDYTSSKLHPADLKSAIIKELTALLSVVQAEFKDKDIIEKAYSGD